jgi:exodeoxyribonuclease VII large subunit
VAKVEALPYDDRTVYSVAAFNRGVGQWLSRLPTLWVEGEVTELKRHDRWASVFLTLKDPADGSCVGVTMARGRFDALRLDLADGERVHVFGRPELYEQRAEFKLRALTIERFGTGAHLASLEQLKVALAAEGLFADERKRPLPFLPRRIGIVTGNDAAAKRDVVTTIRTRFPPASVLVAETYVQGPRAAAEIVAAISALCEHPDVDVIVLTRGGGSFEDLLPFSDERVVRAVAGCPVPVVSAVGHEQDTPLCDLAADVRASTPTAAGKLVVPELTEYGSEPLERGPASLPVAEREQRVDRAAGAVLLDRTRVPGDCVLGSREQIRVAGDRVGAKEDVVRLLRRPGEDAPEAVDEDHDPAVADGEAVSPEAERVREPEVRRKQWVRPLARQERRGSRDPDHERVERLVEGRSAQLDRPQQGLGVRDRRRPGQHRCGRPRSS